MQASVDLLAASGQLVNAHSLLNAVSKDLKSMKPCAATRDAMGKIREAVRAIGRLIRGHATAAPPDAILCVQADGYCFKNSRSH